MSFTNVYWAPEKYTRAQRFDKPVTGHLGIDFDFIPRDPVTAGYFHGENQAGFPNTQAREIVTDARPEYFTAGEGVVPTVAGQPRVGKEELKFDRKKFTRKV